MHVCVLALGACREIFCATEDVVARLQVSRWFASVCAAGDVTETASVCAAEDVVEMGYQCLGCWRCGCRFESVSMIFKCQLQETWLQRLEMSVLQ